MSIEKFMMLAKRAGEEGGPRVDVAGRVMATLAEGKRGALRCEERQLMWIAAAGSVAAAVVAVPAIEVWRTIGDPFIWMSETILWVAR
jgi:hypothetical protein